MSQKKNTTDKTLMRLQRPYYEFRKKQQSQTQYIVRKLMSKKNQKPNIGFVQRSPLLTQMKSVLPIFKKANQQLVDKVNNENGHIDNNLQQCSSQSSSNQQIQQQMIEQNQQKVQKEKSQVQINFLRYPYPSYIQKQQSQNIEQNLSTQNNLIKQL